MGKYWQTLQLSMAEQWAYPLSFFIDRLTNLVNLLLIGSVWFALSFKSGSYAGFSHDELLTYILVVHVLRGFILGGFGLRMANEINQGVFSLHLTRPVNSFFYFYFIGLGEKLLFTATTLIEVCLIVWLLNIQLIVPSHWIGWITFGGVTILAHELYALCNFLLNLMAFWTREALGPRFLFDWLLEFASGAYFPLNLVWPWLLSALVILPFAVFFFGPAMVFIGRGEVMGWLLYSFTFWAGISGLLGALLWRRGLRQYSGEGI